MGHTPDPWGLRPHRSRAITSLGVNLDVVCTRTRQMSGLRYVVAGRFNIKIPYSIV